MYPFPLILIGIDDRLLPQVRRETLNHAAEVDREYAGIESAIDQLSLRHDEARLFVIQLDGGNHSDSLKRLSGSFPGRPILVLMEGDPGSSSLVHAMRDGATQIVFLPLLDHDFHEALSAISLQFGHLASKSRVIAVTGAHGGVGSTTIAVNLAYEVAQTYQLETVLAELPSTVGVMTSFLNIKPRHTIEELLRIGHAVDVYAIQKSLVAYSNHLSVLAGPRHACNSVEYESLTASHLIQGLRQLASVVILDVSSTLDKMQFQLLEAADLVVLVGEQTVPSMQMTAESLRLGVRAHSPLVLINRFDSQLDGFDVDHLKGVLGVTQIRTVANDHAGVTTAVNRGQPLRLVCPASNVVTDIDAIAEDLLGIPESNRKRNRHDGVFGCIAHALGVS